MSQDSSQLEEKIKKFVTCCGYVPAQNYLYVYEKDSPITEVDHSLNVSAETLLANRPYLLVFTKKELIIKKMPSWKKFTEKNFKENILRIPTDSIKDLSANLYDSKYYLSYECEGENYQFFIPKRINKSMKFSVNNYFHLLEERFFGLLTTPTEGADLNNDQLLNHLVQFTKSCFVILALLGFLLFHLHNISFVFSVLSTLVALIMAQFVNTDPHKWTKKDRHLQVMSLFTEAVALALFVYSLLS